MNQTAEQQREILMRNVTKQLSKATGVQLTNQDYEDWLEGGEGYAKFDNAVTSFLGEREANKWDKMARLNLALIHKLNGGKLTDVEIDAFEDRWMEQ